jgi:hypothetical protein
MPKIGKPKVKEAAVKEEPKVTITEQKRAENTVPVFFGNNELEELDSDVLDKILLLYGVSVKEEAKKQNKQRLTEAFKRELINAKQEEYATTGKPTPKGLLEVAGVGAANYGKVHVNLGLTINQGNYSSLKIDAGTELPINFTDAQLDEVKMSLRKAMNGVQNYIEEDLEGIESNMGKFFSNGHK